MKMGKNEKKRWETFWIFPPPVSARNRQEISVMVYSYIASSAVLHVQFTRCWNQKWEDLKVIADFQCGCLTLWLFVFLLKINEQNSGWLHEYSRGALR
jgi:hypothetical protein